MNILEVMDIKILFSIRSYFGVLVGVLSKRFNARSLKMLGSIDGCAIFIYIERIFIQRHQIMMWVFFVFYFFLFFILKEFKAMK